MCDLCFLLGKNTQHQYDIMGPRNTQHRHELELINPRFVVSHRPYEGLKLRAGFHTGDVIAGVQVQNFEIKKG